MDDVILSPVDAAGQPVRGPGSGIEVIHRWDPRPANTAREMVRRHGRPQEITESLLLWRRPGPWSRIVVYRNELPQSLPWEHLDCLEHAVPYAIPVEAVKPLAEFSTCVVCDRSARLLVARCQSEEVNTLLVNLSHFVIAERWSPDKAKHVLLEHLSDLGKGLPVDWARRFVFDPREVA